MQIRTRLTIRFSIIVSVILILLGVSIYYFFSDYREKKFNKRLREEALTTAKLYSDVDEVTPSLQKIIDENAENNLPEERVLLYNLNNKLLYTNTEMHDAGISADILEKVKQEKEIKYNIADHEAIGIFFKGKAGYFVVVAMAFDEDGLHSLEYLRYLLITAVLGAIAVTAFAGFLFARQALDPISDVVKQVDKITVSNLNLRVNTGNGSDEIAQLAIKFNKMLERLEAAFVMQRGFVSNASHELRTPLTAITGQIEVAIMNQNLNTEAKEILGSLLEDIKQLNKLSNGLLDLAQANLDISEIKLGTVRIDEALGLVRAELMKRNKDYKVELNFSEYPDNEDWLTVSGNEQLIRSALMNTIENSCKYSADHIANVALSFDKTTIRIKISDHGIGISENDLKNIFEPFFRAANVKNLPGHGIGLTLSKKIIDMHQGNISLQSEPGKGTIVEIILPHI
ncbi:MAG: signal transduction histidine kinase [Bacteroidetes bacterium]|jgi:signal transduction histidine kinase|nr:signal transduction histidine kinase [Bacteroidota bacterium]